ncbi:MAG TPA: hypothetical protein PKD37_07570 [Oligoflexia bacterium]|nr:hypothetical protein [Oligoflexia bacterium]HMP27821.1 hypothetical protein [Oligoflexia bacterium]
MENLNKKPLSYLALFGIALGLFVIFSQLAAYAQTDLYVRGAGRLIPIAIPELCLRSGVAGDINQIPQAISRDLDLSGYFQIQNPASFIERPGHCGEPVWSDWSVLGSDGVVRGEVDVVSGQLNIKLYLYDIAKQRAVLGKEYSGDLSQVRKIAHKFANEIMRIYTGESGPFGTRVAYSSRLGRFKELFVMDLDGANNYQLTNDLGLAISPSWLPDGSSLIYTSYRRRQPDLFIANLGTKRAVQITNSPALEIGARFFNQSDSFLVASDHGGESAIYLMGRDGRPIKKLAGVKGSIETSPAWSPDGSKIAFCSSRGGGPQIYIMNSDGSDQRRISYVSSPYCTSPRWSPKGDKIAFVCRGMGGGFQLFVSSPDGSSPQQLTASGDNEDPTWSPEGRYLIFATTASRGAGNFALAMARVDNPVMKLLTNGRNSETQPDWGPLPQ